MITAKLLAEQTQDLRNLRGFVQIYEEIAATRMQKVRGAVMQARSFLDGLTMLFADVRYNYRREVGKFTGQSRLTHNGQTVAVFLSANSGLFGDIVDRVFAEFVEFVSKNAAQVVVVGRLGLRMMEDRLPKVLYNYFDLSDEVVDPESLGLIMRYLLQFERIVVFYGKFHSLVVQNPTTTSVSGDDYLAQAEEKARPVKQRGLYLFEPSLTEVLGVFESEILSSIFAQTIHESHLAKLASRMQHLDRAVGSIDKKLAGLKLEGRRLKHKIDNKKQLTRMSGMSLWGEH